MKLNDKTDPRTKKFYKLAKQDIAQLNNDELAELREVSLKMEMYVTDPKVRRSWIQYSRRITQKLEQIS